MAFSNQQQGTEFSQFCPLCSDIDTFHFHTDKTRDYFRCNHCALVFVPPQYYLSAAQEKTVYDQHENNPQDAGYRQFLSRLLEPLCLKLQPGSQGLDFGCGPGPTLSVMLEEKGFDMEFYDPFYAVDPSVLERQYDFITCTEVVEHLHSPGREFERFIALLKPGGWLGIMTKLMIDQHAFINWHYKNDPTHVCFFSRETFSILAELHHCEIEFVGSDVTLMCKT